MTAPVNITKKKALYIFIAALLGVIFFSTLFTVIRVFYYGKYPILLEYLLPLTIGTLFGVIIGLWRFQTQINKTKLEKLVSERTADLVNVNDILLQRIELHNKTEKKLKRYEEKLEQVVEQRTLALKKSNEDLQTARLYLDNILQSMGDMLLVTDCAFMITQVNQAVLKLLGFDEQQIIGIHIDHIFSDSKNVNLLCLNCNFEENPPLFEAICVGPNAQTIDVLFNVSTMLVGKEQSEVFVFLGSNITYLKQAQRDLAKMAHFDALTLLPNRILLHDRLQRSLAVARRNHRKLIVAFIDLDRFKYINDSLGHGVGDQLLQTVAQRLIESIRETDTAARLGGDEFVLLLDELETEIKVLQIIERVLSSIAQPITVDNHTLHVTCSIGCSIYPDDAVNAETLLKLADTALYRAKDRGRANYQFFTADMQNKIDQRMTLEADLRNAIENNQFELYYQAQVDINSGTLSGFEALIRWHHPQHGMILPNKFIPLAEEIGLIYPIGEWVIQQACIQSRTWQEAGFPPVLMAINLSIKQFLQNDIEQIIITILQETGLSPALLELELTESLSTNDPERCIRIMEKFKEKSIKLAIDDFGTGYSSLSYLKKFPLDKLKIDRAFIKDITVNPQDLAISTSIIAMAHSLDIKVIAEGVETLGQLTLLANRGCDEMQGYFCSRPLPADECIHLLQSEKLLDRSKLFPAMCQPTLLLVDDDVSSLNMLINTVNKGFGRVLTCTSAAQALTLLATENVWVIISDEHMPGISGNELLHTVQQIHPNVVRILLTGMDNTRVLQGAVNNGGVFKILYKPCDQKLLNTIINDAINKFAQNTQQYS